ncbi:DUF1353 domain-containing protein [Gordonia sp. NPDC003376]
MSATSDDAAAPEVAESATPNDVEWVAWRVAPHSGFEVAVPRGHPGYAEVVGPPRVTGVGIVQIDEKRFIVLSAFRYSDEAVEHDLVANLIAKGRSAADARRRVDDARTFTPRTDNPTDLASIPQFLRWFENPYGLHSLAALIHDELITHDMDAGALGSDTLSDRFLREMMRTSGVPWLKRWIMWAAVALRTRFDAGGLRRWSIITWLTLSVLGIASALVGVAAIWWHPSCPVVTPVVLPLSLVLIFVAAGLWGRQWGAGVVAAAVAFWLVPAAIVAGSALAAYLLSEKSVGVFRRGAN